MSFIDFAAVARMHPARQAAVLAEVVADQCFLSAAEVADTALRLLTWVFRILTSGRNAYDTTETMLRTSTSGDDRKR